MHCAECCFALRKPKSGKVPVHYVEQVFWFGWAQKRCNASGTTRYVDRVSQCSRPRSNRRCPCCERKLTLKKNGKFPVHNNATGQECPVSRDNRH